MKSLPKMETCFSPSLLHLYDIKNSIVVIIDVFRATSTIAAALHNGANAIIPIDSVDACIELGTRLPNSITAGERDGKVAPGLQYGNSPLEYSPDFIKDQSREALEDIEALNTTLDGYLDIQSQNSCNNKDQE